MYIILSLKAFFSFSKNNSEKTSQEKEFPLISISP